ncbi:MAG: hypothetical protein IBX56_10505 [Methylomicrobium sp.]|nr:hypothetical protein [Methylomicrobium sp.]
MSVFFNGRLIVSPATMTRVDDTAMYNRNPAIGNVLAIIGPSDGGKPLTALRFGSTAEAKSVLRGGESLKAIEKAFDASPQTAAPSTVVFVRVNPATQSVLTLKDAADNESINLVSEGYGRFTRNIRIKVESGTLRGKKLTTQFGNDFYTLDNVARNAIEVSYSGAATAASITVADGAVTLTADAVDVVLDLTDFSTVAALADRINAEPDFTAEVLDGNHNQMALNALDAVTAQDIKVDPYIITGNLQACIDWINGAGEGFVTATRAVGATAVPANIPFSYLDGGSDGVTTVSEWQDAFDELQKEDVQWLVPVSDDPAIHAMTSTHVSFMSDVARMERRAIVGTALDTLDDDAIAAAKLINSDRVSLTHLGFYDYDERGALKLYPAYIMAALLGGMICGVNPGTPLTNKAVNVRGLERKLRNPVDTDQLILGGVLTVEETNQGFKVVKSISTWLINRNYNRVEISTGVAMDYVARAIRESLDALRGSKASPILLSDAVSRTETTLIELSRVEPQGIGVLVGDKVNPPFRNIQASIEGDVLRVQFECSPVLPVNYILATIHAVPWSGSASI